MSNVKEQRVEVKTFLNYALCDCGEGRLLQNGKRNIDLANDIIHYQHECEKCKTVKHYETQYPYVTYDHIVHEV